MFCFFSFFRYVLFSEIMWFNAFIYLYLFTIFFLYENRNILLLIHVYIIAISLQSTCFSIILTLYTTFNITYHSSYKMCIIRSWRFVTLTFFIQYVQFLYKTFRCFTCFVLFTFWLSTELTDWHSYKGDKKV